MPKQVADPLGDALAAIDKKYGKGSLMRLGDETEALAIETFSTGSIALDEALGIGGLPWGRVVELYGVEMGGKTTVALSAIAQVQKLGKRAAFIDAEHALNPEWARTCGVDTDELFVNQPDCGEEGLEIADTLAKSGAFGIIVVDSVSALVPKAEIDGEMGDAHMGLQARLMSQAMRKLTGHLSESGTTALFINQLREKVGIVFGNPEVTSGGRALKFYSSVRLEVRRIESLKDGADIVGNKVRIIVSKNKCAPPFKRCEVDLLFSSGLSREGELIDLGVERGVLRKSGTWYGTAEGVQLGQGKENTRCALAADPALAERIEKEIRALPQVHTAPAPTAAKPALITGSGPFSSDKAASPV